MTFVLPKPKMKKWSRTNTTRAADFPVFGVDKHSFTDGHGKPRHDAYTFVCRDWCNVIARTAAREVVMIWQYRFGTDELTLEIPGGVIDRDETPENAAKRELREETGYGAKSFSWLTTVEPNPALQGNACHTYVAENAFPEGDTALDDLEEIEIVLVPETEILKLIDNRTIKHALAIVALEKFARRSPSAFE